MLNFSRK